MTSPRLEARSTEGALVKPANSKGWQLSIPPGETRQYRWAQLDDYLQRPRRKFLWKPPLRMTLKARLSQNDAPGTWGFGFWNDPFSASLRVGGAGTRLPCLPNAAWFFHASAPNHLSLTDSNPGSGLLAMSMASPRIPAAFLLPALAGVPLLAIPPLVRMTRRLAGNIIRQQSKRLELDATRWHDYQLEWLAQGVTFFVDDKPVFFTNTSPAGPLGLVLWVDNQFMALPPDGHLKAGTLPNAHIQMDLAGVDVQVLANSSAEEHLQNHQ